jgi:endoglycosylceramidase
MTAFLLLGLLLLTTGAAFCEQQAAPESRFARTHGKWIVDEQGRVLILHGVNLSGWSKAPPFLPWQSKDEVTVLRKWGFNSVRYLIVWEAVEPQPGQYDDAYLDRVAERLDWCREAGLKVILDMHQDLYARKYFGDGAPEWACLDDGIAHSPPLGGWFMGYLSPAVMRAFDGFYANKPGPGGVGIQDRFIAMWQHVAERFRDDANIIGYDLLNEPAYGQAMNGVMGAIAAAVVKELGPEAAAPLSDPNAGAAMSKLVQALVEKDVVFKVLDEASPLAQAADRAKLQPFYDRLTAAIRAVDPHHVIFCDTAYGDMSGTKLLCALEAPKDASGRPFTNAVLAPHTYDFSTDFEFPYSGTQAYIQRYLERAQSAADRMGVPTWFGEWGTWEGPGVSGGPAERELLVSHHVDAFDALLCGWCFWEYGQGFKKLPFLPLLTRPYAQVIAGVPERMQTTDDRFDLEFTPQPRGGETVIWVPPERSADVRVTFSAKGTARSTRDKEGRVHIACSRGAGPCRVTIHLSRQKHGE